MTRGCLIAVLAAACLTYCGAAPRYLPHHARRVQADNATASTGNATAGNASRAAAEEQFQRQAFIDLSKFRNDEDIEAEERADEVADVDRNGDALDRESVATFQDTIAVRARCGRH